MVEKFVIPVILIVAITIGFWIFDAQAFDFDGDGIDDPIDLNPFNFSSSFSDVDFNATMPNATMPGTTFGTILDRGDQILFVFDVDFPDGVRIIANNTGGPNNPAIISTCTNATNYNITAFDDIIVTCTSSSADVIVGPIEALFFGDDGTVGIATLQSGDEITFEPEAFIFTNDGDQEIIVEVDDEPILIGVGDSFRPITIDIKPGSDPNCFNNDGHGVIPIAILGSDTFDATQVNPTTVKLDSQDVKTKGNGDPQASIEDVNSDGFDDLIVKIIDTDGTYAVGTGMASLTGELFDGTPIEGTDSICITQ